jgi:hypothetical protein
MDGVKYLGRHLLFLDSGATTEEEVKDDDSMD